MSQQAKKDLPPKSCRTRIYPVVFFAMNAKLMDSIISKNSITINQMVFLN